MLPRISQEVEHSWDPLDSPQPIHSWIFPWLPHLSLSHLFPTIRRKFHIALAKWSGPEDTSVRELIQPWKGVFDDKSFGAMVSRDILPRLSSSLRKFKTNVNLQDLAAFNSVAEWREHALITSAQFLALLEGDFFLPWLQALYDFCVGGGGKKVRITFSGLAERPSEATKRSRRAGEAPVLFSSPARQPPLSLPSGH